jgi:hypothetical protein
LNLDFSLPESIDNYETDSCSSEISYDEDLKRKGTSTPRSGKSGKSSKKGTKNPEKNKPKMPSYTENMLKRLVEITACHVCPKFL